MPPLIALDISRENSKWSALEMLSLAMHLICDFIFQLKLLSLRGWKVVGSFPPHSVLQTHIPHFFGAWNKGKGVGQVCEG